MMTHSLPPRPDLTFMVVRGDEVPKLNLTRPEIAYVLGLRNDPKDGTQAGLQAVDKLISKGAFPSFKIEGTRLARFVDVLAYNDSLAAPSLAESKEADAHSSDTHPSHTDASDTGGATSSLKRGAA